MLALLSGCTVFTTPAVRYFEVRPPAVTRQDGPLLPVVLVQDFSCAPAYDHLRVVRRASAVEIVTVRSLQWASSPGRMLSQGLRSALEQSGRFEAVKRAARPRPPYFVQGHVLAIEIFDDPVPAARLALRIALGRSSDNTILFEESFEEEQASAGRDAADGVAALRSLYASILDRVLGQIITAIERDQGVQRNEAKAAQEAK